MTDQERAFFRAAGELMIQSERVRCDPNDGLVWDYVGAAAYLEEMARRCMAISHLAREAAASVGEQVSEVIRHYPALEPD